MLRDLSLENNKLLHGSRTSPQGTKVGKRSAALDRNNWHIKPGEVRKET